MTPFSDHINAISFDICHCYDFFIGVLAVYLKKTMVMFNLRKKHWPWVKTQICFPGLKFVFPRTWPRSYMILARGYIFNFFDLCVSFAIFAIFCTKGGDEDVVFSSFFCVIAITNTINNTENILYSSFQGKD